MAIPRGVTCSISFVNSFCLFSFFLLSSFVVFFLFLVVGCYYWMMVLKYTVVMIFMMSPPAVGIKMSEIQHLYFIFIVWYFLLEWWRGEDIPAALASFNFWTFSGRVNNSKASLSAPFILSYYYYWKLLAHQNRTRKKQTWQNLNVHTSSIFNGDGGYWSGHSGTVGRWEGGEVVRLKEKKG